MLRPPFNEPHWEFALIFNNVEFFRPTNEPGMRHDWCLVFGEGGLYTKPGCSHSMSTGLNCLEGFLIYEDEDPKLVDWLI